MQTHTHPERSMRAERELQPPVVLGHLRSLSASLWGGSRSRDTRSVARGDAGTVPYTHKCTHTLQKVCVRECEDTDCVSHPQWMKVSERGSAWRSLGEGFKFQKSPGYLSQVLTSLRVSHTSTRSRHTPHTRTHTHAHRFTEALCLPLLQSCECVCKEER